MKAKCSGEYKDEDGQVSEQFRMSHNKELRDSYRPHSVAETVKCGRLR